MIKLIAPASDTIVVKSGLFWNKRKWHFLKGNASEIAVCGATLIDPVYSTLGEIGKNDLCQLCWPFEKGE
jgi:hypothetical protein